jgi:hypothetical protein
MKRVFSTVMALMFAAGIVAVADPAAAATGCSASWHYITHGETGFNLQPDPLVYQGNTGVSADGVPGVAPWNQQFLFCRDPGWAPGHYAVYSNLTARYWDVTAAGGVYAGAPVIADKNQLFEIRKYDSTWWTIRWVGGFRLWNYYVHPDRTYNWYNPLMATTAPLSGNHLYRITPSNLLG